MGTARSQGRRRALRTAALVVVTLFVVSACDGNDDPTITNGDEAGEGEQAEGEGEGDPGEPSPSPQRRREPGDREIAVEPLTLEELPDPPDTAATGILVFDGEELEFAVEFCSDDQPIGNGEGEGVRVAWDLDAEGDRHRAAVRMLDDDARFTRAGPAEMEQEGRTVRFAGAFLPFRETDPEQAVAGGFVAVCPERDDAGEEGEIEVEVESEGDGGDSGASQ